MPPTLILNYELRDPPLTPKGVQQCADLEKHLRTQCPLATRIEHIVTSPMRRTIQTTQLSLQWLIKSGIPVECDAMWQENSAKNCDTGSDLQKLAQAFPELDFSNVDPTYPDKSKGTPYAFERAANLARGETCLRNLYDRPEKVIAVVSHAGFLRTGVCNRRFANADYRIFTFRKNPNGNLTLLEDESTERKGGAMGRSDIGVFGIKDREFPPENAEDLE